MKRLLTIQLQTIFLFKEVNMSYIIAKSSKELGDIESLIKKDLPSYRQAYSDRTSWIMACLCELVYIKFNPLLKVQQKEKLIEIATSLIDENKQSSLKKLIKQFGYDEEEEKQKLIDELSLLNLKLEKTFDSNGTQAMVVSNDKFHALVFRGTEPTCMKDIKADLKATIDECETGGKIHKGFKEAFEQVAIDLQKYLDTLSSEKPLFITGHSLGGALATIATKKLIYKHGIAACYTYGSPRVCDEEWMQNIKVPIYRISNAADPVTMLPPSNDIVMFCGWLVSWIPNYGNTIRKFLLSKFGGYYHIGYVRHLTNVENGAYENTQLLYAVSFFRKMKAYYTSKKSWTEIPSDHSISVYRKKLKQIAIRRQDEKYK